MHRSSWAATLLVLASPAYADDAEDAERRFFFSNPSQSSAQVAADWDECRELASSVRAPQAASIYAPGLAGAAVGGFMKGLVEGAQRRHMFDAALRKCMSVKGYQRYRMSKPDFETLYSGKWPELRQKLADRAIAPVGNATRLEP